MNYSVRSLQKERRLGYSVGAGIYCLAVRNFFFFLKRSLIYFKKGFLKEKCFTVNEGNTVDMM